MNTLNYFEKTKEEETLLNGVVRLTQFHQDLNTDVVMVEVEGYPVFIKREDLEVKPTKASLVNYIGENISFQVIGVDAETGLVTASGKKYKERLLDGLAEEMKAGKTFQAEVTKILSYGAYMKIGPVSVQMLNVEFSEDYTTIKDILSVGDKVEVEFSKYTPNKNLQVKAKTKYQSESAMSFDVLSPNQVVLGVVRNVKPWGCYVCVAPNLDALCPIPPTMDIQEGDKVNFKITQVKSEEKRVRGKILKKLALQSAEQ